MSSLPIEVIAEDRRLVAHLTETEEDLARLRWHWTLNEDNPDRMSFRRYADGVDKSRSTIAKYANGYATWVATNGSQPLDKAIVLANMNAETAAATEAVAKANEISVGTASNAGQYRAEVKEVVATARDRAERNQTTVEEEIPKVAEFRAKARRTAAKQRTNRKAQKTLSFSQVEGHLAAAKQYLMKALTVAREAEFEPEALQLLADSVSSVQSLLHLLDVCLVGSTNINWDEELAKLEVKP